MQSRKLTLIVSTIFTASPIASKECTSFDQDPSGWISCIEGELRSAHDRQTDLEAQLKAAIEGILTLERLLEASRPKPLPIGFIGYFDKECPVGWARYFPLTGRYVVGAHEEISIGAQVGEPMENSEKRVSGVHSHSVVSYAVAHPDWAIPKVKSVSGLATEFRSPNARQVYIWEMNWPVSEVGKGDSAAPYVQLRACLYKGG